MQCPEDIIRELDLSPHPEGGYYRRIYQGPNNEDGYPTVSSIYYLLTGSDFDKWHRLQNEELWLWHSGSPVTLEIEADDGTITSNTLGTETKKAQSLQILVPTNRWQRAKSNGNWSLVSCVVVPGFSFDTYELIQDPSWHPTN